MNEQPHPQTPEADFSGVVVFLSGDLMFASRVRGAAENAGLEFKLSGRLPEDAGGVIRYVILDLATMSKLTGDLPEQCANLCADAKVIAYGPHVQVAKLDAAKSAGIESVLTRGQFDRMLPTLFQS
ncbi:histidine kinase [Stieleria marina]|uniref:Uncharacterized protein n=1 Tax=Stieleria marina TaxID=1930275 RepID=A0A517NR67_9BACT|nr:hypothetical protein K239x_15600 [Planctomycetes bacterium K23_9]